jgi:P450-derived glycosyltransferase activator
MSTAGTVTSFVARLYGERLRVAYDGYVTRDPVERLSLRPGRDDPYALYERIRDRGTLSRTRHGGWVTPSYELSSAVLRDRGLTSSRGVGEGGGAGLDEASLSFLGMNPPDHTRLRSVVRRAFSPRALDGYRPRIERSVDTLLDAASARGSFDLVGSLAAPLPIAVITDLLGIPDEYALDFAEYGATIGSALDGIRSLRHAARLVNSQTKLAAMFDDLFARRRADPRDDVISTLANAPDDVVAPGELRPLCFLLLIAGFETTVNLIGNCVLALLDRPPLWRELCADPVGLAGAVVEETLRFDPPVQRTSRYPSRETELAGRLLRPDEQVVVLIGAANRDPAVYRRPDEFDPHRAGAPEHLAFSAGTHYCLGGPLARLEAQVAVRRLAERMPHLQRAGAVRRRNATTIRGPVELPVRLAAAPRATGAGS